MVIEKTRGNIICDVAGCMNMRGYSLYKTKSGNPIYLCEDCMKKIAQYYNRATKKAGAKDDSKTT